MPGFSTERQGRPCFFTGRRDGRSSRCLAGSDAGLTGSVPAMNLPPSRLLMVLLAGMTLAGCGKSAPAGTGSEQSGSGEPLAQVSTEGLAYWRPHFGTLLQVRPNDTYHFRSGMAPGLAFALFNVAGYPNQIGKFIPDDFPYQWMRDMVAQLKIVRPYYYGDYYPLLPCSANSDCTTDPSKENSAAFEWAAWQFNRPEQGDGMVQAFRRDENDEPVRDFRLRGLDPAATYEISNLDTKTPHSISGKDLMQQGLHIEIPEKRGAAIIIYKKAR